MSLQDRLTPSASLPEDHSHACLVGRVWVPGHMPGPSPVTVINGEVFDLGPVAPTVSALFELDNPVAAIRGARGLASLGRVENILSNSAHHARRTDCPFLLAPADLQAIKAAGVTFAVSLVERVIEEQAGGDYTRAAAIRERLHDSIGVDIAAVKPGSSEAQALEAALRSRGLWSQYLEVGIGPYAEVFTKAQVLSAVGTGAEIGIYSISEWNNPEPEVVLAVNSRGHIIGATLGNDVNLRDIEGRSALLLGKAKDNNASCAIGPFIRLFDERFSLSDVERCTVNLTIEGPDNYRLEGESSMAEISRTPGELVTQTIGAHHQYPDGFMLFLGTLFAPTEDRDTPGQGFTHKVGDIVTISAPALGALVNRVNHSERITPWTFGVGALMTNLAARGRLQNKEIQ